MIKINLNGKDYNFPTSWDDISMKQYCKLFHDFPKGNSEASDEEKLAESIETHAAIISRLLGENDDFALNIPINDFIALQDCSKFVYTLNEFLDSKAFYMVIDGKKYWIPTPEEMSLRQYIDCDMIIKEASENEFIELLACLLLPMREDGKYEYDGKYQELIPRIESMKASEGLPFIYTFFKKKELSKKYTEACSKVEEAANQLLNSIQGS